MTDEATVPRSQAARTVAGVSPTLTIIAHPDPERVPSQVQLRSTIELSRTAPAFVRLSDGDSRPLADRYISRSPMLFKPEHDSVWVLPSPKIDVEADGVALTEPTRFGYDDLERGVVLLLHGRIALVLHSSKVRARATNVGAEFGLVGCSDALARVRDDIRVVSDLAVPVLIRGESGTGKELIASAIHREGLRAKAHYEALNMATLAPSLAASELFGHVRGAFTGADRNRDGCFVRADGGTLFLDEIGETPLDTQAQLLRVLETQDLRPVGGSVTRRVDVRMLAATDADLEVAVRLGRFREALLQRIAGFRILVPALRHRRVDVGPLILHFVRLELASLGRPELLRAVDHERPWLSAGTVARLARYHWPGNVRELRNVVRQLVITGRFQAELQSGVELEGLLRPVDESVHGPSTSSAADRTTVDLGGELGVRSTTPSGASGARYRSPQEIAEDELIASLRAHRYRLAPTAQALNLSRTSLYTLVEQCERIRKASDLDAAMITEALDAADGMLDAAALTLEVSTHALKLRMRALGLGDRRS